MVRNEYVASIQQSTSAGSQNLFGQTYTQGFTQVRYSAINGYVSTQELINKEVENLPEALQREVYDFARYLRGKSADESFNGLLLSASALSKDWDTPEEDAAWENL